MAPRETENNTYAKFGVTKKEHYGTAVCYGIFWSGQLCWYSGTSIYLEVLGMVNEFDYLSNSKIIYMEKNLAEFRDLFLQRNSGRRRNENIILPRPETNFIRNSIRFRGAIAWNSLMNKETRAKTLKEFKRCLVKFDTDKMNFVPLLATAKNRDFGYEYF